MKSLMKKSEFGRGKFSHFRYLPTGRSGKSVLLILRQVCGLVGGLMEGM